MTFLLFIYSLNSSAFSIDSLLNIVNTTKNEEVLIETKNSFVKSVEITNDTSVDTHSRDEESVQDKNSISVGLSVKVGLKNYWEYQLTKDAITNQSKHLTLLRESKDELKLKRLYNLYLEQYYFDKILNLNNQRLKVAKDIYNVTKKMVSKGQGDMATMLKAQSDLDKFKYAAITLNNKNKLALEELNRLTGKQIVADNLRPDETLLPVSSMKSNLAKISSVQENTEYKLLEHDFESSELEYKLESETNNKYIKSFDVGIENSYNINDGNSNKFSVGVTFNLPFAQDTSIQNNKKYIRKLEAQMKLSRASRDAFTSMSSLKSILLEKLNLVSDMKGSSFIKQSKRQLSFLKKTRGSSPLQVLGINQIIADYNLNKVILEKEVYMDYIELLAFSGILVKHKNTNLLKLKL